MKKYLNFPLGISLVLLLLKGNSDALQVQQTTDGIKQSIPSYLIECYNSTFITTQDNLLPMTVNSLVSLIRKIEDAVGTSMDVRTMSSALLSSYRYDGIRFEPRIRQQYDIRFAVEGTEFALWKFLYDKIIAKTNTYIPNDALTWVERCSLHRMLTMSVEWYVRGDEDNQCSKLGRLKTFRYPRDVSKLADVEIINPKVSGESRIVNHPLDQTQSGNFVQDISFPLSSCPIENGVIRTPYGDAVAPGIVLAGIAAGSQPQTIPPKSIFFMSPRGGGVDLRRKPTYNSRYPNNNPTGYPGNSQFKPNVNAYGNSRAFSQYDSTGGNDGSYGGGNPYGGNRGGGGGGTFGGGGAGGGRGVGNPSFFGNDNSGGGTVLRENLPYPSNTDNIYASTLAGELAFEALWMGTLSGGMQIGRDGGWNDTAIPKYYFQKLQSPDLAFVDAFTDARIRGSIDGLLLGKNIEDWVNVARGSLKLSQVLNMYYSDKGVLSSDIKSCKRRDFYEQVAPISELQSQTYSVAYYLSELSPYPLSDLPSLTADAANQVRTYIASLRDPSCPSDQTNTPSPTPVVDLHFVVDFSWDFHDISSWIQYTIDHLEIWKYGGNFTIINGKDGSVIIESSRTPTDLANNFTYSVYRSAPIGFDFTKLLSQLRTRFQDKLEFDKQISSGGGIPRALVFMPYASPSMSESERSSARYRLQYFKEKLPDVKIFYLVAGNKNNYSPFANSDKDIFVVTPGSDIKLTLDPFIYALATTPRRIINPNCGKSWSGSWYNEMSMNGYLDSNELHYYRVHPNYFFRGANAKITILADGNVPVLTICTSRDNPLPIANLSRSGSVSCKQITNGNRFELVIKESDCHSVYYANECKPFYFSVANMQAPSKAQISIRCTDQECRDPDMTKYTIRHSGLTCYSSATKYHISLPVLLIAFFLYLGQFL